MEGRRYHYYANYLGTKWLLWIESIVYYSNQDAREKKAHFEFGLHADNIDYWNITSFQSLGKNTKNRITCLTFLVVAVWICTCLDMNYLRIWITKSASKNCSKMGFVAVDLTELSYFKNRWKFTLFYNLV